MGASVTKARRTRRVSDEFTLPQNQELSLGLSVGAIERAPVSSINITSPAGARIAAARRQRELRAVAPPRSAPMPVVTGTVAAAPMGAPQPAPALAPVPVGPVAAQVQCTRCGTVGMTNGAPFVRCPCGAVVRCPPQMAMVAGQAMTAAGRPTIVQVLGGNGAMYYMAMVPQQLPGTVGQQAGAGGGAGAGAASPPRVVKKGVSTNTLLRLPETEWDTATMSPSRSKLKLPAISDDGESVGSSHSAPADQQESTDDDGAGTCAVCLCEYEEGDLVKTLPCLHRFHTECVDQWLAKEGTCCVCKTHVKGNLHSTCSRSTMKGACTASLPEVEA